MNKPLRKMSLLICLIFLVLMASTTSLQVFRASSLNADARNVRTLYHEYGVDRGPIIVNGTSIASSTPSNDEYRYQRVYDSSGLYSHLTGYFSTAFSSMTGLERSENSVLGGTDSALATWRLRQVFTGKDRSGGAIELTINAATQQAAAAALGNYRGAAVAIDPSSGAILAAVSTPTFDANALASHDAASAEQAWEALNQQSDKPLVNRAFNGDLYPPGSTFKVLTTAAMLENNPDLTPESVLEAPTSLDLPGTSHQVWNYAHRACGDGSGSATLDRAFAQSCNTPFAIAGMNMGAEKMRSMAHSFGFNQDLSVPLKVTASQFPEPDSQAALAMDSFGQQDIRVTPLQMAMIASAVANKGTLMTPYLVNRVLTADLETVETTRPKEFSTPISERTSQVLTTLMKGSVEHGTSFPAAVSGVQVAGKTGTAENGTDLPHSWFIGFAPADNPKIALAVMIENVDVVNLGEVAAYAAKPIFETYLSSVSAQ